MKVPDNVILNYHPTFHKVFVISNTATQLTITPRTTGAVRFINPFYRVNKNPRILLCSVGL
jgi:hypothetical protein